MAIGYRELLATVTTVTLLFDVDYVTAIRTNVMTPLTRNIEAFVQFSSPTGIRPHVPQPTLLSAAFSQYSPLRTTQSIQDVGTPAYESLFYTNTSPQCALSMERPRLTGLIPLRASTKSNNQSHSLYNEVIDGPLIPLNNNILVKRREPIEQSEGGVLLPSEYRDKQTIGVVLASGPGEFDEDANKLIPTGINAGDVILFGKHEGENLVYDGDECLIINANDVLAKLRSKDSTLSLLATPTPESIIPVQDIAFVKLFKRKTSTESGLFLAADPNADQQPTTGTVVAVGTGITSSKGQRIPMPVSVGDNIQAAAFYDDSRAMTFGDNQYVFIHGGDILAKW